MNTSESFVLITGALAGIGRATFDTNVPGTLLSLKHEMRVMLKQGHGAIFNLSSIAGQVGFPGASVSADGGFTAQ